MEPERPQTPSNTGMASDTKVEVEVHVNQDLPWNKCVMGCTSSPDSPLILLRCLHALCSDACLSKLKEEFPEGRNLHCKICNVLIEPEDLEKRFTPSNTLRRKLSLKDLEQVMRCEYCVKRSPAVAYCETCPIYLCGRCQKVHAEAVTTHTHKPNTNLDERRTIELEVLRKSLRECDPHKNESREFCFTCQAKVCDLEECRAAHGEGHEIFVISEEEEKLPSKLDTLSNLMGRLDEFVARLETKYESVKGEEWGTFVHLMDTEVDRIVSLLIARCIAVKREARKVFNNQLEILTRNRVQMEKLRSEAAAFRETLTKVSNSFDELSTIKFSLLAKSTESRLFNDAKSLEEDFDKLTEKDMHFILNCKVEPVSIDSLISTFGSLEYAVDPTYKPTSMQESSPPRKTAISKRLLGSHTITLDDSASTEPTTEEDGSEDESPHGDKGEPPKVVLDVEQRQLPKSSGAAARQTTGPGGHSLDMPQLHRSSSNSDTSTPPSAPLPGPPTVSSDKPALKTDSSSKAIGLTGNPVQETSVSQSELGQRKTDSGGEPEPMVLKSMEASLELTSSSEANPTDGQKVSGDSENTPEHLSENGDMNLENSNGEEAPSLDNGFVNGGKENGGHLGSVTPRKNDDEEPEMPLLTPCGSVRKRRRSSDKSDGMPEPLEDIKAGVISPTTSSAIADTSVRTSGRERKQKVFPDCVNPQQKRGSKKDDRVESPHSTPPPSRSSIPRLRRKSALPPETHLDRPSEPPTKLARVVSKADDVPSIETVDSKKEVSAEVKREVESENGSGAGSGSESSSNSRRRSLRSRPDPAQGHNTPAAKRTNGEIDVSAFPEAPMKSMEKIPSWCNYPLQGTQDKMKTSKEDTNEDYCCICLDGGGDVIVCCDFCPKVFHLRCHMPPLAELPGDDDAQWHCNFDKTKEDIDQEIGGMEVIPGADEMPLTDANPAAYLRACKFMIEVYKLEESPTIKWKFPEKYFEKYNKVPYHLKFLREKLCRSGAEGVTAFQSVREYMEAFKQLFTQAFLIYKKRTPERKYAMACFDKFRDLVDEYYPDYQELFDQV